MDLGVISVRYARALLKSAMEQKTEDQVYRDMQTLAESYIEVPDLRSAIANPMLPKDRKEELLATACGISSTELTKKFLGLVLQEGRGNALQFMAASYLTLYRKQKNIIRGKLTTAAPVSPQTQERMKAVVQTKSQGTVEFNTEVDPEIIGGFILEYDTYKMDVSVKSKLNAILTQLTK